jgi:hypothetical protein
MSDTAQFDLRAIVKVAVNEYNGGGEELQPNEISLIADLVHDLTACLNSGADPITEAQGFALELALDCGFRMAVDEGDVYVVPEKAVLEFHKRLTAPRTLPAHPMHADLAKLRWHVAVLMRDAFMAGRGRLAGDTLTEADNFAWVDYNPPARFDKTIAVLVEAEKVLKGGQP